VSSLSL